MAQNVTQERSSKFLKDLGIYAIGNLGAKIITFAMMAVYSFFVKDTGDFGYYDLCFTIILLVLSFTTLQLRDGTLRFLLDTDNEQRRSRIVTFIYRTLLSTSTLCLIATAVVSLFTSIAYVWYSLGLLIVMTFYEVVTQIARGLGKNKVFVLTGIISSSLIFLFSIIFVVIMGMGIKGIFITNILARLGALIFMDCRLKILATYFKFRINVKDVATDMLKYSIPLIPASLCWWLTSGSDRWFISHYVGLDANGVYAIAARFTGIIQVLAFTYYQAWQETSILQYHSSDRDKFFTNMLNSYISILVVILTLYTFSLKLLYPILVGSNYQDSLQYIYPLGISAAFYALVFFFDMGYQCAKDTKRSMPGVFLAAFVNVVLNIVLVQHYGPFGAIAASIITFVILLLYRIIDTRRYFKLSFHASTMVPVTIMLLGAGLFYIIDFWWLIITYMLVACALCYFSIASETRRDIQNTLLKKTRFNKQ